MAQHRYNKLRDPWLTGSLLLFSGSLVCSVVFQNWFYYYDVLLGFSVFGLLVSLVYATLPDDAESKTAYFTAKIGEERKGEDDTDDDEPTAYDFIYGVCLLLAVVSFFALVVSIVLAMCFGLTHSIFLMEAISAGVFGATFWISLFWPVYRSPSGFSPWWWGL